MPIQFTPRRGPAPRVLTVLLAGGEGRRLHPLTADRAKPAVPVGGRYRLIDFVLSNFVNSGLLKIKVLTQYKSDSLNTHLARGWRLPQILDQYVEAVPAQMRTGPVWFRGSADALFQSLNIVVDEDPDFVCVFMADHICKMDVRQMIDFHVESRAEVTVAVVPMPVDQARAFGVIGVDAGGQLRSFEEKPEHPAEIPGRPGWALASMGNYVWNTDALVEELRHNAATAESQRDFGRNILPHLVAKGLVAVYDFTTNVVPGEEERSRGYWRDVGTLQAYFDANLDLIRVSPTLNLYNRRWPVRTWAPPLPPAKFVFADADSSRAGVATDSLVCEGCVISGGHLDRSVLSPGVRVNSYAHVEQAILLDGVSVGRRARLRRVIVDKNVKIPEDTEIGFDREHDRVRGFTVAADAELVVVPKGYRFC